MQRAFVFGVGLAALVAAGCAGATTSATPDGGGQRDGPPVTDAGGDAIVVPDGAVAVAGRRGMATLSGAVTARSTKYRIIMNTGESPGGGGSAASAKYQLRGGVVGVTQGK
ncbi:MAG: hypothetical protein HY906_25900 [Deltaproteobacteria bacterium]|nr:hypothetical protein [Deltaproteobacteria bacterium]